MDFLARYIGTHGWTIRWCKLLLNGSILSFTYPKLVESKEGGIYRNPAQ